MEMEFVEIIMITYKLHTHVDKIVGTLPLKK